MVDASVGLKWCLPQDEEAYIPQARELLDSFLAKRIDFLVPDLFWVEIGNALWKLIRRKKLSPDTGIASLTTLYNLEISTVPSYRLIGRALDLAVQYDRTVYDSVYVALARESSVDLVTADERLANALAAYLPVKWLGTI